MTTVTVDIDSREVRNMIDRAPQRVIRALRAAMDDSTVLLLREMQTYPPQRPGSTYDRTDTLKRSWHRPPVRALSRGLVGEVVSSGNMAPYNRQVQDQTRQAAVHRGRWTNTAQEVARRNERTIQRYFDRRLREEFSR
jgi:hypothetical protein